MMEAVLETTGGAFPAHTYLLDGSTLVAYIKSGESAAFYFKKGIKNFDKRGRRFSTVATTQFKQPTKASNEITVTGSRGQTYRINTDQHTCTCPGFTFRGQCRHLAEHGSTHDVRSLA
jgi:hypothetical protein